MGQLKAGIIACTTLLALTMTTFAATARADPTADIKALEDRFVAAFKAKDVDAIMKVYAPAQTLVVFDVVPPRQYVGALAYRKNWQAFLDGFDGPITVERSDLDVVADRNLAYHALTAWSAPTSTARSSILRCGSPTSTRISGAGGSSSTSMSRCRWTSTSASPTDPNHSFDEFICVSHSTPAHCAISARFPKTGFGSAF